MAQKTAAVNTYTTPSFGMQPQGPVWETLPETSVQVVRLLKKALASFTRVITHISITAKPGSIRA